MTTLLASLRYAMNGSFSTTDPEIPRWWAMPTLLLLLPLQMSGEKSPSIGGLGAKTIYNSFGIAILEIFLKMRDRATDLLSRSRFAFTILHRE